MTDTPTPLDPDEVACPKCEAPAGSVCLTPTGRKSRTIHVERRRAAAGEPDNRSQVERKPRSTRTRKSPATPEGRSKGGKTAAQARRRRRAEQEAAIAEETERKLREEAEANAVRLAEDAVRYADDRALLKRQTLDAARSAATRLLESLDGLRRPAGFDDQGKPRTVPVELFTTEKGKRVRVLEQDGTPAVRDEIDVVGWYGADTVERLAKVAASTLNSLRLEEGKATGIEERRGPNPVEALGEAGVDELLEWAARNLRDE